MRPRGPGLASPSLVLYLHTLSRCAHVPQGAAFQLSRAAHLQCSGRNVSMAHSGVARSISISSITSSSSSSIISSSNSRTQLALYHTIDFKMLYTSDAYSC